MIDLSDSVWSAAVVLLFVMDPLGNLPVVISLLRDIDPKRRRFIILRELFFALGILLLFLFLGQTILDFLELQQESVTIAGGIVLLVIGLRMVFPQGHGIMGDQPEGEPFLVPLAVPLIAGPSAMATLILMARSNPDQTLSLLFALVTCNWTSAKPLIQVQTNVCTRLVAASSGLLHIFCETPPGSAISCGAESPFELSYLACRRFERLKRWILGSRLDRFCFRR